MSASLRVVPAHNPLAGLIQQRQALAQSLEDARAATARVRAAAADEADVLAAIGRLGAAHVEAIRVWAAAGGKGEMPSQDIEEAKRLGDRLVAAQAQAQGIQGATAELEASAAAIAAELRTLEACIADEALSAALDTIGPTMAQARDLARQAGAQIAEAFGLCQAIRDRGAALQSRGHHDQARPFFAAAEQAAAGIESFTFEPTSADILRAAEAWRTKLAEQTGGVFA